MIPDESRPIFIQLAARIEDDILGGALEEEAQVPSTNEFAAFYRINPATAGKAVNLLVTDGVLYKRRGIGMFVATGARETIRTRRRDRFQEEFVAPLLVEASRLGLTEADLVQLIRTMASTEASASVDPSERKLP